MKSLTWKQIMHPHCLQSSLEQMFSNKNWEEHVVFPEKEYLLLSGYCPLCWKTGFSSQPVVSKLGSTNLPAY